jgi:hypothetical protein
LEADAVHLVTAKDDDVSSYNCSLPANSYASFPAVVFDVKKAFKAIKKSWGFVSWHCADVPKKHLSVGTDIPEKFGEKYYE